jgi:hypothetical protein
MANGIIGPVIAAAAGLLGVAVGGYFTAYNQKRERQQRRVTEQLAEFYGPMLMSALVRITCLRAMRSSRTLTG